MCCPCLLSHPTHLSLSRTRLSSLLCLPPVSLVYLSHCPRQLHAKCLFFCCCFAFLLFLPEVCFGPVRPTVLLPVLLTLVHLLALANSSAHTPQDEVQEIGIWVTGSVVAANFQNKVFAGESGCIDAIVEAMRAYPGNIGLQQV